MQLASLIQEKRKSKKRRARKEKTAKGAYSRGQRSGSVDCEMTLHVPCHVTGTTASGLKWIGRTKTVALSEFGAHVLLPADVDLEGEVSVFFRIPSALRVLFRKDAFHVTAEIRPSDTDFHWPTPSGQKVVSVAFSRPLRFKSWAV